MFASQVIIAEAEHSAELSLPCPKLKDVQEKAPVEEVMVTEAVEPHTQEMTGTPSTICLLALRVPACA